MDSIIKALHRARQTSPATDLPISDTGSYFRPARRQPAVPPASFGSAVRLSDQELRKNRIIAFDGDAGPTRHYDLLRNQMLHRKNKTGAHIIAVSSPTRRCGTTVTSVNLAFSLARISSNKVLIVDANDENPAVRRVLGLPEPARPEHPEPAKGECVTLMTARNVHASIVALPGEEQNRSKTMARMASVIRATQATVAILDLPPMMPNDRALSFIGIADSVIVVLAAGLTTVAEVEACKTLLGEREDVQFVLNKAGRHGL